MGFVVESRHLEDIAVVVPKAFRDERGFFVEVYRADQFKELGLPTGFVQDNHSLSRKGVLRGLHFQWEPPMGKLMRVTRGNGFSGSRGHSQGVAESWQVVRCGSVG